MKYQEREIEFYNLKEGVLDFKSDDDMIKVTEENVEEHYPCLQMELTEDGEIWGTCEGNNDEQKFGDANDLVECVRKWYII